jgi:hypothetical protein
MSDSTYLQSIVSVEHLEAPTGMDLFAFSCSKLTGFTSQMDSLFDQVTDIATLDFLCRLSALAMFAHCRGVCFRGKTQSRAATLRNVLLLWT